MAQVGIQFLSGARLNSTWMDFRVFGFLVESTISLMYHLTVPSFKALSAGRAPLRPICRHLSGPSCLCRSSGVHLWDSTCPSGEWLCWCHQVHFPPMRLQRLL